MLKQIFTNAQILTLLTNAIEGGSNYWYLMGEIPNRGKHAKTALKKDNQYGDCYVYILFEALLSGESVEVFDIETDEHIGTLTYAGCVKASALLRKEYVNAYSAILNETDDSSTADIFFQLSVMGELVYG